MSEIIGIKNAEGVFDLCTAREFGLKGEEVVFDNSIESLSILRHSCAHLMAQAIKTLYPEAKFFVGPVVDEGFYYDFEVSSKISEEDLGKIEEKMKELAKQGFEISRRTLPREEVIKRFEHDDLKMAVISRIDSPTLSLYSQGDFEDLCRGPHLPNTKFLHAFKLTKVAGAYLGGDEKAKMLTRIYGIAFADKDSLKHYLFQLEEAKKRDHRKLGVEMGLFTFDEDVGAGLPIWLPKGARLRRTLEGLLTRAHIVRYYEPVRGPELLKSDLWKISGHYANYGENMYFTQIDEVEYGIKPMNCVGHIKVYQSSIRSYRELPLRFYEYGVVHRHEKSGVLHGLLRVREFTQDDAHIFCKPDQIRDEIISIIKFAQAIMEAFGFQYEMEISTKPEKSIGDERIWEISTQALKDALSACGIAYGIDEGGGAFYGPKIDMKITDAIGRKWQCGTVQIDMNLPQRFALEYIDEDNTPKQPVMIHRAILGSFERFVGILIEHFAGELPFFIAPTQVIIIPISQDQVRYAQDLRDQILERGAYAEIFNKNETLSKRVRSAEKQKVPMIIVLGEKEIESKILPIRDRREKSQYELSEEEFLKLVETKMKEVSF
ncbi:threonine--tRNA ligase [Helicobacter pametensis]|uniref:threonine--tRNA ligase n=1 Tax=Helicobacter pametensis TaxID=95149 RepID=UPI0004851975|nr:threonine--tRNA ligase [Helicobacter pametensis]